MGIFVDLTRRIDRAGRDKRVMESAVDGAARIGKNLQSKGAAGLLDRSTLQAVGQLDRGLDVLKRSGLASEISKHLK